MEAQRSRSSCTKRLARQTLGPPLTRPSPRTKVAVADVEHGNFHQRTAADMRDSARPLGSQPQARPALISESALPGSCPCARAGAQNTAPVCLLRSRLATST